MRMKIEKIESQTKARSRSGHNDADGLVVQHDRLRLHTVFRIDFVSSVQLPSCLELPESIALAQQRCCCLG